MHCSMASDLHLVVFGTTTLISKVHDSVPLLRFATLMWMAADHWLPYSCYYRVSLDVRRLLLEGGRLSVAPESTGKMNI